MTSLTCADILAGRAPRAHPSPQRLGAHAARFEGRVLVRARVRRLVLPSGPGRRAATRWRTTPTEVLHLTAGCAVEATARSCLRRARAAVRDAGERDQGGRLGRGSRHLSDSAEAAHARIPARSRAPPAAHQHLRRGDARSPHPRAGDPPLLRRARLRLGAHADHHRLATRRGGRAVPRLHARS